MCTTISIFNNSYYMCKSMDFFDRYVYSFTYFPKNYFFEEDIFGVKLKSKYSMMGTVFRGYDQFVDGINEYGLMGSTNSFRNAVSFAENPEKEKLNLTSTKLLNVFLANCKDIEEVKELSKNIKIFKKSFVNEDNFSMHYHYMFTDIYGKSVVLEFEYGIITCYDNKYNIMTNSPVFPTHIKKLEKAIENNSIENIKNVISPSGRFLKAYHTIKNLDKFYLENKPNVFFQILDSFAVKKSHFENRELKKEPTITIYHSILDSLEKSYTFRYFNSKNIIKYNINEFKDSNEKIVIDLNR